MVSRLASSSVPDASLDEVLAEVPAGVLAGNGVRSGEGGGVLDDDGVGGGVRYEMQQQQRKPISSQNSTGSVKKIFTQSIANVQWIHIS